jgi:hypothetical protein
VERVKALGIFAGGLMATGMTDGDGLTTPPGSDSEKALTGERRSMPSEALKSAIK